VHPFTGVAAARSRRWRGGGRVKGGYESPSLFLCERASGGLMAFLRSDDASGTQHPLVGTRVNVGRAPTNEVVLERDMSVSRHHAVFDLHDGQWTVTDDQSANGTFVNGERTLSCSLQDRDRITVGNTTFVFVEGDDPLETEPLRTVFGERVLVTLLFTDIVSSTEQASRLGDREWKKLLDRNDRFAREQVQRFRVGT
jgi:pSer/pThr/pTyr-binding forkhead associated (FHA) protein